VFALRDACTAKSQETAESNPSGEVVVAPDREPRADAGASAMVDDIDVESDEASITTSGTPKSSKTKAKKSKRKSFGSTDSVAGQKLSKALDLYKEAHESYIEERYGKAAILLEEAYSYDPDPIYQYNRIRALQANGEYAKALQTLHLYKEQMVRDPDRRFEDIEDIRAKLQKQVSVD
jgi:tetratricopeptide (TPR) repeat protein